MMTMGSSQGAAVQTPASVTTTATTKKMFGPSERKFRGTPLRIPLQRSCSSPAGTFGEYTVPSGCYAIRARQGGWTEGLSHRDRDRRLTGKQEGSGNVLFVVTTAVVVVYGLVVKCCGRGVGWLAVTQPPYGCNRRTFSEGDLFDADDGGSGGFERGGGF